MHALHPTVAVCNEAYLPAGQASQDTVIQIKQAIMDTAKPTPTQDGHDDDYGYGMIQIANLLDSFL